MAGKHTTIADTLADALIEDILSGHYRVGERLPSERDLAARFEANRGAVREAMKKLDQLGLASIGPGGARVNAIQQASLDIVGNLMARGDLPDAELVDQILTVISSLTAIAAEGAVTNGTDEQLAHIRTLIAPLTDPALDENAGHSFDEDAHQAARFALMQAIMLTSGNLICQLIARTLFEQFAPAMEPLREYTQGQLDVEAYTTYARQLDRAVAARDIPAMRATFEAFSNLNRKTLMQGLKVARASTKRSPTNSTIKSTGPATNNDVKVAL